MNILGISFNYHDAAACLVQDGVPIAACEEERFTRRKHDARFPEQAIAYCLARGRTELGNLDCIAFYEKPARKLERILQTGAQHMPASALNIVHQLPKLVDEGILLKEFLSERLGYRGKLLFCEHHLSHAASTFFVSPFENAAILTVDGTGEWTTCSQMVGIHDRIRKLREIVYPDSLGLVYSALTAFLGFNVNDDEYKVMGLASFGEPVFKNEIEKLIHVFDDGSFALNMKYFTFAATPQVMFAPILEELLGKPRQKGEPIERRHKDIAASLQAVTEDVMVALARSLRKISSERNLCLAGGVAYNCVANSKIAEQADFENIFVQPAAGDNGAALGAALWAHYEIFGGARETRPYHTYLGPDYSAEEILGCLSSSGLRFAELTPEELCERTARLVFENFVIGWFQGRMEFGPRALGNRSIIANPCSPQMQDILNRRIKFREEFRPFAPAVAAESASKYFELNYPSPFMLFAPRVRAEYASRIPAVVHVDETARVQTVMELQNPLFYKLLRCFERCSGVPILVNTSFNVRGEPIVCSPEDAVNCFMGTDIDFLAIGNFMVSKV